MAKINILSICGGGIRGIIPMKVLVEIERLIHNKMPSITNIFDLYVATSIGSVIICGLLLKNKKYTAKTMMNLFNENASDIFSNSWKYKFSSLFGLYKAKYSGKYWYTFIREIFGNTKIKDLKKRIIIPIVDTMTNNLLYIDSYDNSYEDMLVSDVLLGATAAPYYFPPYCFEHNSRKYCFIDGGISINNPSILSVLKAKNIFGHNNEFYHLALGTGYCTLQKPFSNWGLFQWTNNIIPYIMHTTNISHENHLALLTNNINYFKINPKLSMDIDAFDNAKYITKYLEIINLWIKINKEEFNKFIKNISNERITAIILFTK